MSTYLFIDGAYLDEVMKDVSKKWAPDAPPLLLNYSALARGHDKVFYYDCLPIQMKSESEPDFELRKKQKEAFFEALRALPGWHVSEGLAKHRRQHGAQQKEVDILIAVDMLSHTHRRNMQKLTFIAGDQDFRPLVEAVVREGMYVELRYHQSSIAKDLRDAADTATRWTIFDIQGFLKPESQPMLPLPNRTNGPNGVADGSILEHGCREGKIVASLWQTNNRCIIVEAHPHIPQTHLTGHMRYEEPSRLKAAYNDVHGPTEWAPP